MCLTCHYVNDRCEQKSLCLDVIPFQHPRRTSENICELLKSHIPCTAHTLQLVIKDTFLNLKNISDMCAKSRRNFGYFKHCGSATKHLKCVEINMSMHRFVRDEPTQFYCMAFA
ncbi:hypothetical protein PR048_017446 [Dryococelus australis]|uniref:Uncharacterized protein n=1 Tax=Dryococelus australis TaxID=614101 RepID=A0ABQ9HA54_9NEOP|nr:hypothetical protein PR048_017446 [Dryococelus australis]